MIPRDFVTEWRSNAPWVADHQVEQDLVISRALVELFSRQPIAEGLGVSRRAADMKPLLASGCQWNFDHSISLVWNEQLSKLPGAPWQGSPSTGPGAP